MISAMKGTQQMLWKIIAGRRHLDGGCRGDLREGLAFMSDGYAGIDRKMEEKGVVQSEQPRACGLRRKGAC